MGVAVGILAVVGIGRASGDAPTGGLGWGVEGRDWVGGVALFEDGRGHVGAGAADGGYAQSLAEFVQIIDAVGSCAADLFVGDGFADADVHADI